MGEADTGRENPETLSGDEWRRLRDLFCDVQEMNEGGRRTFLDDALAGEPRLRAAIDSYLANAGTMGGFLAPRSVDHSQGRGSPGPGSLVGPYRLLELLGEGGFGVVYLAEQEKPLRRRVALKLIKPGMDTGLVIARFEAERQALAIMDHPAIAQVFDAGETEAGRPFFAMEYVSGVPITSFCDSERLRIRERLDLFLDVCDAVQHAHQRGIIHRDLKPSNVLVARRDGKPVLKVIDFGIVKATTDSLTQRSFATRDGIVLGTMGYMSPEQAGAIQAEVDTRSDIYSLGVLLYELLTGELPFDRKRLKEANWGEAVRIISEEDPPSLTARLTRGNAASAGGQPEQASPVAEIASRRSSDERALLRDLRGELEWITLRAIEKEPDRRYASASELSGDIRRHLANEPVLARPQSTAYRMRKFARRHRVGVAAACLVMFAITVGGIVATVGFTRAVRAERAVRREAQSARRVSDFLVDMFRTSTPDRSRGETITARQIVDEGARQIKSSLKEDPYVRARLLSTLGQVHQNLGMYEEGVALLREGLAVAESAGTRDELEVASRRYALAAGLRQSAAPQEISDLLDRAIPIAQNAGVQGHSLLLSCLILKARWYNNQAQRASADSLAQVCIGMMESAAQPDTQQMVLLVHLRGNVAHNEQRLQDAEQLYLKALELSDRSGREPTRSVYLNENLAALYRALRRPDKSMEHAERGLALARKMFEPNHPTLAWSLRGYSDALYARGDYERAVATREQVVAIYRANPALTRSLAQELVFASAIYREMGRYDRAIACGEEACLLNQKGVGALPAGAGEALSNLAHAYRDAGFVDRADSSYRAAIVMLDQLDPRGVAAGLAYRGYGSLCRDIGRHARAESLYLHAEAIFDSTREGLLAFHGECLADRALLRSLQGRHEEAESMMQHASQLMLASPATEDFEMRLMYTNWARARVRAGDTDGAIKALGGAARSRATSRDVSTHSELAALRSRADFPPELRN